MLRRVIFSLADTLYACKEIDVLVIIFLFHMPTLGLKSKTAKCDELEFW